MDFTASQVAPEEGTLAQLVEEFVDSFECPVGVQDQMETTYMYDGGYCNALNKIRHGHTELLYCGFVRKCDLDANSIQDYVASFGQAPRCVMIRLERSTVSTRSVANGGPSHYLDHSNGVPDIQQDIPSEL